MAVVGEERMRSAMSALDEANQAIHTDLGSSAVMFKMVAEDLEAENQTELVEELGDATHQIIALMEEFDYYNKALRSIKESYTIGTEPTDFEKLLSVTAVQLKSQSPQVQPEQHPLYKQFKEAVWKVHHGDELMPGQEKEDLIITCTQYNVANTHCPISGKPVEELDDPVRSLDCQHIYDRSAVMDYLRQSKRNKRTCSCAIAGCPKPIAAERLVCDPMLKVEIQELRMRGQRGRNSTQVHDVADFTEITEIDD